MPGTDLLGERRRRLSGRQTHAAHDPPHGRAPAGHWVRLDLLIEADIDEMHPLLSDPAVYADGYVMHRRPTSLDDSRDLAQSVFLATQGQADGKGAGRTAYAIRLARDSRPRTSGNTRGNILAVGSRPAA